MKALKSEMGGCISFSDLEGRKYSFCEWMTCSALEKNSKNPSRSWSRQHLHSTGSRLYIPERGASEGAGGNFLGVLIRKKGLLARKHFGIHLPKTTQCIPQRVRYFSLGQYTFTKYLQWERHRCTKPNEDPSPSVKS